MLKAPPELVFNIAEGFGSRSREAHVPAVCELLKVPVTHSDPLTLALSLDKGMPGGRSGWVASGGARHPPVCNHHERGRAGRARAAPAADCQATL